jgi:hypothetical protein
MLLQVDVLTSNPFLRSEGEEEVQREGSTVGAGASGGGSNGARGRGAVARGPRGGRGSRAAGLRGTGHARGRRGAPRPELRAAAAMGRKDAEQWREDPEAAGAAGRPGCAKGAAREDDDVRGGRSFGRRQQWREDVGAAGKLGRRRRSEWAKGLICWGDGTVSAG